MTTSAFANVEILSDSADRLVLLAPHSRLAIFFCGAALVAAVGIFVWSRRSEPGSLSRGAPVILTFLALLSGCQSLSYGRMTFNKSANKILVEKVGNFGRSTTAEVSFADVRHAEVRTSRSTEMFCLVLRGGGCVSLRNLFTSEDGNYAAADAVNEFLGLYSSPSKSPSPTPTPTPTSAGTAQGVIEAQGSDIGNWRMNAKACVSGQRGNFFGAVITGDETADTSVMVVQPPSGLPHISVDVPHGDHAEVFYKKNCTQFDLMLKQGDFGSTGTRNIEGHLAMDCQTDDNHVWGELTMHACH